MKRQAAKRRKAATAAEIRVETAEVAVQTDAEVLAETDTVPAAAAEFVKVKEEVPEQPVDCDEEMPETVQDGKTFSIVELGKRYFAALESGFLTDVTILVGEETIKCHSQVVSFASPKLAALVKEKEPRLPDINSDHFRLLLQIIYSGALSESQDMDTLLQVGRVAHDLQVHAAVVFCAKELDYEIDSENLWPILDFADLIDDAELIEACYKVFRNKAASYLQTDGFLNCSEARIKSILKQKTIYNVTELQLFEACVAWSNVNSEEVESRRAALGPALQLIRFRLFSAEDFAEHVSPTGLLSLEMERNILRALVTGKNFLPEGFSESTSSRDPSQVMVLKLSPSDEGTVCKTLPDHMKTSFKVTVNKDVFIHGAKLRAYRSRVSKGSLYEENVSVTLTIKMPGPGSTGIDKVASFRGEVKKGDMITVKFKHPIQMSRYSHYSLNFAYAESTVEGQAPAYYTYSAHSIKCDSGLEIEVKNDFSGPPDLHLIVADKCPEKE